MGLIAEGCVPFPWCEGGYNSRLEVIKDMPKGTMLWGFDTTDMARAKKILGDNACLGGNFPLSILELGNVQDVKNYIKRSIRDAGQNGGFIVMNGAAIEAVKPENLHALIDATKEFGVYK